MSARRVLVVDDSAFMRGAVARLIDSDPRFEVVGQARDGEEAVRMARELSPDVISMDFNMPRLNGAQATRAILAERAVGIVMLSAHTKEGAEETLDALGAGAVDFVPKPGGEVSTNLSEIKDVLLSKLAAAGGANLKALSALSSNRAETEEAPPVSTRSLPPGGSRRPDATRPMPSGLRVIAIASSTGGPAALTRVVPRLDLRGSALVIVQHMPEGFTRALADQLSQLSPFKVQEATGGEQLREGVALVAPGGFHLQVERGGIVRLTSGPPVHGVRPAADVTLKSVGEAFGPRAVGVVLTGMGRDGALGLASLKAAGGRTLAQDQASSVVYGMPKAAAELGVVDEVVALERVAATVTRLVAS
ncbi:MAG: chemotaxis response regulator protein-glutamate methylesterase [Polyangiaceae bacterium]